MGSAAIALFINDATSKVINKVERLKKHEKKQSEIQTESFTGTVSHEMRTPIQTLIFFMRMFLVMFSEAPFDL